MSKYILGKYILDKYILKEMIKLINIDFNRLQKFDINKCNNLFPYLYIHRFYDIKLNLIKELKCISVGSLMEYKPIKDFADIHIYFYIYFKKDTYLYQFYGIKSNYQSDIFICSFKDNIISDCEQITNPYIIEKYYMHMLGIINSYKLLLELTEKIM